MISNGKVIDNKVVELIDIYNFFVLVVSHEIFVWTITMCLLYSLNNEKKLQWVRDENGPRIGIGLESAPTI
jgi:hypothetical protein